MADAIGSAWRSFWHTMTSYDRHASHNSPYRTGQHVPLPQSRHATLTSVATDASDSHTDLSGVQDPMNTSSSSSSGPGSTPYAPGMRSAMQRRQSADDAKSLARSHTGEIQMQSFNDGLPPAPPVGHSWRRIDRWAEENFTELFDNISEGCTQNDINELEHELDCTLPMEVRESLQIHDGQERGGLPTGIIFGCMLLDCEEIVQEWKNWRTVNDDILSQVVAAPTVQMGSKALGDDPAQSSSTQPAAAATAVNNVSWKETLQARQDSQPSNAVQKAYAHTAWIPLARDWGGNCLAVDLAPGSAGKWGQVIIMGRDYDCKFVVARSWAAFLATVADDITSNKVFINDEGTDLKLREFKQPGVEPAYLDILRWRCDQKYGRKPPRRKATGEMRVNSNVQNGNGRNSPYGSPVVANGERRHSSPQRSPGKNVVSPTSRSQISSPLARVAEETAAIDLNSTHTSKKSSIATMENILNADNLVSDDESLASPTSSTGAGHQSLRTTTRNKENILITADTATKGAHTASSASDEEEGLKTVDI